MHRWRVPSSFCVVWFARAGIGSLALALVTAGCSSGTAAGGGAAPGRGRGGRGGAQPVVTAKVTQKDVPIDIAAVGNVEAYTTISLRSQVTGQIEEAFSRARSSRRRSALQDRPSAPRIGPPAVASQRDARPGAAQAGRSAARSGRQQRGVSATDRRAPGTARGAWHHLEGLRRAITRAGRCDRGDRER